MGLSMSAAYTFFLGALMMGMWTAGVFFFRFWSKTRDRLFLLFGVSFWLLSLERLVLVLMHERSTEDHSIIYLLRLLAFGIILGAIVDKNRQEKR
jgi:hypothetical protein